MKFLFLTAALALAVYAAGAQPGSGGPGPGMPPVTPITDVPLDGGASLLLASGLAFGLKHLRQRRQWAK